MTAICPAGPPKLSAATRIQTQKASRKETECSAAEVRTPSLFAPAAGPVRDGNGMS